MSNLINALNCIGTWLLQNPDATNRSLYSIQEGLNREQITEWSRELPCLLPEEVYEFYQWSNGGLDLSFTVEYVDEENEIYHLEWNYGFVSLDYALRELTDLTENQQSISIGSRQTDAGYDLIEIILGGEVAPVVYIDSNLRRSYFSRSNRPGVRRFSSLTEMIVELAECCLATEKHEEFSYPRYYVEAKRFQKLLG